MGWSARFLGGTGRRIGLNVESGHFSGLKQESVQVVPETSEHYSFYFF